MVKESKAVMEIENKRIKYNEYPSSKLNINNIYIPKVFNNEISKNKREKGEKEKSKMEEKEMEKRERKEEEGERKRRENKIENENKRKESTGGETSCTSEECSPEKKKTFLKVKKNKNKIPFKGEAKDFKIKYKTELCKYYEINGYCKYGNKCAYAHGKENLRSKVTNTTYYRTKKCVQFYEQGYCPYGNRCQFAHQLKSNIINNPYDRGMTYSKILETISKLENVENIKKLIEKPRLPVFKELCENKENIESRLLEDIKGLTYKNLYKRKMI